MKEEVKEIVPVATNTEYALTSPNLIYATTVAASTKENKDAVSNEVYPLIPVAIGAAKAVGSFALANKGLIAGLGAAGYLLNSIDRDGIIADNIERATNFVGDKVSEGAAAVGEKIKDKAGEVYDAAKDKVKEKAGEAWDAAKDKAGDVWDKVKEKAGEAASAAGSSIKEKVGQGVDAIKEKFKGDDNDEELRSDGDEDNSSDNNTADTDDNNWDSSDDTSIEYESYKETAIARELFLSKEAQQLFKRLMVRQESLEEDTELLPELSSSEEEDEEKKPEGEDKVDPKDVNTENVVISMEAANIARRSEASDADEEDVTPVDEKTLDELSENKDNITRLENAQDLVIASMLGVENGTAEIASVTTESAIVFTHCVDRILQEVNDKLRITNEEFSVKVSTEEAEYDPKGSLYISNEGIKDFFSKLWASIKSALVNIIRWIKKLYRKVDVTIRAQAIKANKLLRDLTGKSSQASTLDEFNNDKNWALYSHYIRMVKGSFVGLSDYYDTLKTNNLTYELLKQVKESLAVYNSIFSDKDGSNIKSNVAKLADLVDADNIIRIIKAHRNKYVVDFDKSVKLKEDRNHNDILTILVNNKKIFGIEPDLLVNEKIKYYKYNIVEVEDSDKDVWKQKWKGIASINDVKTVLTKISKSVDDSQKLVDRLNDYSDECYTLIDMFDRIVKDKTLASDHYASLVKASASITRLARTIVTNLIPCELINYSLAVCNITDLCTIAVNRMK